MLSRSGAIAAVCGRATAKAKTAGLIAPNRAARRQIEPRLHDRRSVVNQDAPPGCMPAGKPASLLTSCSARMRSSIGPGVMIRD
jgi:hypothetical protein